MRGEEHRLAARLEALHHVPELPPRLGVESGGRLVEEEQIRIGNERARDGEALLLSARKLLHPRAAFLAQSDEVEHLIDLTPARKEAAEEEGHLFDRQLVGQMRLLQRDADPVAERRLVFVPAHAEHFDLAARRRIEALEDLAGRGLPRAVRPQKSEALPAANLEIEAVDGGDVVVPLDEAAAADGEFHQRFLGRAISTASGRSLKDLPLSAT